MFQTGSVGEGLVLSDRPGLQVEMIEEFGTTLRHAANLAVIVSAMANTVGGTIYIGRFKWSLTKARI